MEERNGERSSLRSFSVNEPLSQSLGVTYKGIVTSNDIRHRAFACVHGSSQLNPSRGDPVLSAILDARAVNCGLKKRGSADPAETTPARFFFHLTFLSISSLLSPVIRSNCSAECRATRNWPRNEGRGGTRFRCRWKKQVGNILCDSVKYLKTYMYLSR